MKKFQSSFTCTFIYFSLIYCPFLTVFASEIPYGTVIDVRVSSMEFTARFNQGSAASFPTGKKIYVVRAQKAIGSAIIGRQTFSNMVAKYENGIVVMRSDKIVLDPGDIAKLDAQGKTVVDFADIGYPAHGWISEVSYKNLSDPKVAVQTQMRKLILGDQLTILQNASEYYSGIDTNKISSIQFSWNNKNIKAQQVVMKDGNTILCSEVLAPYILKTVKPPKNMSDFMVSINVVIKEKKDAVETDPVFIPLKVIINQTEGLFSEKFLYKIKVYGDGIFINEFSLNRDFIDNGVFNKTFYIPPYGFRKGKNTLEFYQIKTNIVDGNTIETGEEKKIGNYIFQYDQQNTHQEILIKKSGLFNLSVEK